MQTSKLILLLLLNANLLACTKPLDKDGNPISHGTYRLRTFPSGAKVWIDGELKIEETPATLILKEGKYHLRIQLPGAVAIEKTIEIEAGRRKDVTFNIPKPPPATVSVLSDVTGAKVRINGYVRGRTPLDRAVTKPGPMDMTVVTPDGRAKSLRAHLKISEQKIIKVLFERSAKSSTDADDLSAVPSDLVTTASVTIAFKPRGSVWTDEQVNLGQAPLINHPFSVGRHRLLLRSADGSLERWIQIDVEAKNTQLFRFRLNEKDRKEKEKADSSD